MNLREKFSDILDAKNSEKPLVVPITTITLMEYREKIGVSFPEAHTDVDKMVELAVAPHNFSGIEGINIPFDMTIEAEAMGCSIDLRGGDQTPEVDVTPFNKPEDVVVPDDFLSSERMNVLFSAIGKIKKSYPDVPLIIGIVGPFTLLGQLLGIEKLLKYLKTNYFEVEEALSVVSDALLLFTSKLDEYDVDAICVCEPSSSSDLLDPKIFSKLVKSELEYMSDNIVSHKILHVCGNSNPIIEDMLTCGYNGISIEDIVDLGYVNDIKRKVNTSTVVCGNISTNKALLLGTPSDVESEVFNALDHGIDLLCSSCSVPPHSPEENVRAMITSRDKY